MTTKQLPTANITIMEIVAFARELMDENGLNHWRIVVKDMRSKFGDCDYRHRTIGLARDLMYCTQDAIYDTITHEIAHALVGHGHGHDYVWRAKHISLGGNGKRVGEDDKYINGKETRQILNQVKAKYVATCPNGHIHYANRLTRSEKSCGICSRKFDRRFLVVFKYNT